MAGVDLVDETFISASVSAVSAVVARPARWREWFPDLQLTIFMDRGEKGIRWSVQGAFVGSMEVWLEPVGDGVLLHYYLRVVPTTVGSQTEPNPFPDDLKGYRDAAKIRSARAKEWKKLSWALKDELERDRAVGAPA